MLGRRAATRAALFVCLLVPSLAHAEESTKVSLEEALSRAEQRAPSVVMARHATREASARRVGAGVVMPSNPKLNVDARPLLRGGPTPDVGYFASVEAPFEVGGAPGARAREAERYADVSRAELALEKQNARAAAYSAYVRVQVSEQRIASTRASAEAVGRVLEASKQRADLGASGDIEQSLASSDAAQIEAQLESAVRERDERVMELREVLDLPASVPVELTTPLGDPEPAAPVDALVAKALAARPEVALVKRRIDLLDATEERLSKETFPRVGVVAGVDASPANPMFAMIGLSVEIPVAQRNAGPRAVTRAAREGEIDRASLLAAHITREVLRARSAFDLRRAELDALTARALPTAQRTLELVEIGWRSGRFDIFRVATAARDVARVRALRLDALEAAWLERIALERAVGGGAR